MSSKVLDDWILFPTALKLPVSSKFRPSPDLDLDQFCQVGEQARLNSNSIVMMLVFLLTVLRVEEAGQCITKFSGTGRRFEYITEMVLNRHKTLSTTGALENWRLH